MSHHMDETRELERLFDVARRAEVEPSSALWARVEADMLAACPAATAAAWAVNRRPAKGTGWRTLWARFSAGLGGSRVVAGLTAVMMAGVFWGYVDAADAAEAWFGPLNSGFEIVPAAELFMADFSAAED